MKLDQFHLSMGALWPTSPQDADHPATRRFRELIASSDGMATENKLALLNAAANSLERDEVYLEVGAYRGTSIVGAAMGHADTRFVTVDNFSEYEGTREQFWKTVKASGYDNIDLVEGDFRKVLSDLEELRGRVGVYFYDGPHGFRDQWDGLELVAPYLAENALVVVDDTSWRWVRGANRAFTFGDSRFRLVCRFESSHNGEPRWWNGVEVYSYRRSARAPSRALKRVSYVAGVIGFVTVPRLYRKRLVAPVRRVGGPVKRRLLRIIPRYAKA